MNRLPILLGRATLGLLNLPDTLLTSLLGPMPVSDRGIELDLRMAALVRAITLMGLDRPGEVVAARRHMDHNAPLVDVPAAPGVEVRDEQMPGPAGQLRARVYRPSVQGNAGALPILVYLHGGGFVLGSAQSHDGVVRLLAQRARCVVVSLEYRLAPEHRFPAAVDDALAGFRHVREHARELGGRSDRVAIGGDSAGGNLAAVVCQQLLARDEPLPCLQALIYPATDLRRVHASHSRFAEGFFLSRAMMDWFVECYVGDASQLEDPRASPLLGERLAGLPPALIVTAGFDPLRDEGLEYADKLRAAGVMVEQRCAERLVHGFFNMGGAVPAARETVRDFADALRLRLHG